jgi:hypothetical protein
MLAFACLIQNALLLSPILVATAIPGTTVAVAIAGIPVTVVMSAIVVSVRISAIAVAIPAANISVAIPVATAGSQEHCEQRRCTKRATGHNMLVTS